MAEKKESTENKVAKSAKAETPKVKETKPAAKPAAAAKPAPAKAEAKPAAKTVATAKETKPATAKPAAPKAEKPAAPAAPVAEKHAIHKSKKSRLHEMYIKNVVPVLKKELGIKNINAVPKIHKIVINSGLGSSRDNAKSFNLALEEIALISGQKPIATIAKQSISNFKLREGQKIGAKVTLRGEKMYEFLDRLISIVLPRVRDFKGISKKSFDGRGNYALGIKEQSVFPEISYEKVDRVRGYDIIIVTTANTNSDALTLLTLMGLPFREK